MRVVEVRESERILPDSLRPPQMPSDRGTPWPQTTLTYSFERRHREDTLAPGPLTVTFSDCVDRGWWGFAKYAQEGWPLDRDAVCVAMDFEQTWSGISKIRLPIGDTWGQEGEPGYQVGYRLEFVRRGEDGRDEIVSANRMFWLHGHRLKEVLGRRFTEELLLKHTVVDGVDEYA